MCGGTCHGELDVDGLSADANDRGAVSVVSVHRESEKCSSYPDGIHVAVPRRVVDESVPIFVGRSICMRDKQGHDHEIPRNDAWDS